MLPKGGSEPTALQGRALGMGENRGEKVQAGWTFPMVFFCITAI